MATKVKKILFCVILFTLAGMPLYLNKTEYIITESVAKAENRPKSVDLVKQNKESTKSEDFVEQNDECTEGHRFSDSKWFQTKFNGSVMPFWTEENNKLSKEILDWWLNLQVSKVNADVESTLIKLYKNGVPKHHKDLRPKKRKGCTICAVVGNSANLKNTSYGKVINDHDVVIRFNRAPTLRHEKDVGSKTTHQILYPESAISVPKNASLTLVPFKPLDVEWLLSAITTGNTGRTQQHGLKSISCNITRIAILHPEFIRYVYVNWLAKHGRYPSTGILGVGLAIQICDKIDIYGFGADKNGGWQHYWQHLPLIVASSFRRTGVHDGDAEKAFLNTLESEGIVQLHRGTET